MNANSCGLFLQVMKLSFWASQCFCWNQTDLYSDDEKGFIDLEADKEATLGLSVNWMKNYVFSLEHPGVRNIQICVTFVVVVIMVFGITGKL